MEYPIVRLDTNVDYKVLSGFAEPSRVLSHDQNTAIFLCDSNLKTKEFDKADNFRVRIPGGLSKMISCQLTKCVFPYPPNINKNNNIIVLKTTVGAGTYTITLTPNFYNQTSILTELKNKLDTALIGVDDFTIDYDVNKRYVSIESNGGFPFFLSKSCSFITRGINCLGFVGLDLSLNPSTYGKVKQYSSQIGLIYTRYINIFSSALTRYSRTVSVSPSGQYGAIAFISLPQLTQSDFDVNNFFSGNLKVDIAIDDSCKNHLALGDSLLSEIDIQITDEFGFPFNLSLQQEDNLGNPIDNNFNILCWIKFYL